MLTQAKKQQVESHLNFLCKYIRSSAPHYKITSCLSFCVIAKNYLKKFGINSKIYICDTMVMNQKTYEIFTSGKIKEVTNYEGLHYLHCKFLGGEDDQLGGHTILIVENQYILDPSADQFHRPEKQIISKSYWRDLGDKKNIGLANSEKSLFLLRASVDKTHYVYEGHEIKENTKAANSPDLKPQKHALITKSLIEYYKKITN